MNLTVAMEEYKRSMLKLAEIEKKRLDMIKMEMDVDDVNDIYLIRETEVGLEATEMLTELVLAYAAKLQDLEEKMDKILAILNK